jgi:hypothetical protein
MNSSLASYRWLGSEALSKALVTRSVGMADGLLR